MHCARCLADRCVDPWKGLCQATAAAAVKIIAAGHTARDALHPNSRKARAEVERHAPHQSRGRSRGWLPCSTTPLHCSYCRLSFCLPFIQHFSSSCCSSRPTRQRSQEAPRSNARRGSSLNSVRSMPCFIACKNKGGKACLSEWCVYVVCVRVCVRVCVCVCVPFCPFLVSLPTPQEFQRNSE